MRLSPVSIAARHFVCARRYFSAAATRRAPPLAIPPAASVLLPRSLIAVHGLDSAKFVNGLITTRPPESADGRQGAATYSSMLSAKGRVIADLFVYAAHENKRIKDELSVKSNCYVLEVDSLLVDKVLDLLDTHILLSDVDIELLGSHSVYSVWSDEAPIEDSSLQALPLWAEDKRAPGLGYRVVAPKDQLPPLLSEYPSASIEEYKLRRYLFGVPEGPDEIPSGSALPLESCIDYMGGVDFDKGCYMGQELTIRTHHHGNVRKRVMPVVFLNSDNEILPDDLYIPTELGIEPGAAITDDSPVPNTEKIAPMFGSSPFASSSKRAREKLRPAGTVIAAIGNVGLAKMRIDTLGHSFRLDELHVKPLTPFWWPSDQST